MLWSFQKRQLSFRALTVTECLSALTLTRGLFTELPLSTARYSTQQRLIQVSKKMRQAEPRAVGSLTTECFQTASKKNKTF